MHENDLFALMDEKEVTEMKEQIAAEEAAKDDDDDLDIYELPEEPEVKKEPVPEDDPDYWLD